MYYCKLHQYQTVWTSVYSDMQCVFFVLNCCTVHPKSNSSCNVIIVKAVAVSTCNYVVLYSGGRIANSYLEKFLNRMVNNVSNVDKHSYFGACLKTRKITDF